MLKLPIFIQPTLCFGLLSFHTILQTICLRWKKQYINNIDMLLRKQSCEKDGVEEKIETKALHRLP